MERTFILLKPDCVQRRLAGRILTRFEDKGLNVIAMKMLRVTPELSKQHYAEHVEKPFFPELLEFITSGPVIAMQWSGESAVTAARTMMGPTNPASAPPGTIRGDLGLLITENIVHGSDSVESAERELSIWFA